MKGTMDNNRRIDILFTADEKYAARIPVVLKSFSINDPQVTYHVHLIHDPMSRETESGLREYCAELGYCYYGYEVAEDLFSGAPVNKHYSRAMYYRILAGEILPNSLERILYLDPDILVVNSLIPLWDLNLDGKAYAAATHITEEGITTNINQLRLGTGSVYYNTGVLLMDLTRVRKIVRKDEVFAFIRKNSNKLLLPDQDVFNALYWKDVVTVPDELWNYDVRKYSQRLLMSGGAMDENWIIRNTAVLHYCGKTKPWHAGYRYRFGNLYRHYQHLYSRDCESRKNFLKG